MIGYLSGTLRAVSDNRWIVFVAQSSPVSPSASISESRPSGLGYLVTVPSRGDYLQFRQSQYVELWVYTNVREDALDLYGFLNPLEKELFLALLGVSGVGPKVAMSVLSGMSPSELIRVIQEKTEKRLFSISGVGKKTAERIILELSDSLHKKLAQVIGDSEIQVGGGNFSAETNTDSDRVIQKNSLTGSAFFFENVMEDSSLALQALGFKENTVREAVRLLILEMKEDATVEKVVKSFLKKRTSLSTDIEKGRNI